MALDLTSGGLSEDPGGYQYVKEVFGSPPVTVSVPDTSMRGFALPILQQLGAQMVVLKDTERADLAHPYRQEYGMWVRPVDLALSHWTTVGIDAEMAWWDMLSSEYADSYRPLLQTQVAVEAWEAERLPFVTITIDEFNFYRQGPHPWTLIYYQDPGMTLAHSPPYDLQGPDLTSPRTTEDQDAVWLAYTELVEWAATYMRVVTASDIVELAVAGE
jgi:hypothetical protein